MRARIWLGYLLVAVLGARGLSWTTAGASANPAPTTIHIDAKALVRVIGCNPDGTLVADQFGHNQRVVASSDQMATWVSLHNPTGVKGLPRMLFTTKAGSWLVNVDHYVYRSADGGRSWKRVLDLGGDSGLLPEEITQDPQERLYLAPYGQVASDYPGGTIRIFRSDDDGFTWDIHSVFPTSMSPGPLPANAVRHVHAIQWLPSGLWLATGDVSGQAALWHWTDGAWVRASPVDRTMLGQRWRTASLQERGDRLYWSKDSSGTTLGEVGWAPASNVSAYHQLSILSTGTLYSAQLSDGTLLFAGDVEGGPAELDSNVSLWSVDSRDQVTKIWSDPRHASTPRVPFPQITNLCVEPDGRHFVFSARNVADSDGPAGPNFSVSFVAHLGPPDPSAASAGPPKSQPLVAVWPVDNRAVTAIAASLAAATVVGGIAAARRRRRAHHVGMGFRGSDRRRQPDQS